MFSFVKDQMMFENTLFTYVIVSSLFVYFIDKRKVRRVKTLRARHFAIKRLFTVGTVYTIAVKLEPLLGKNISVTLMMPLFFLTLLIVLYMIFCLEE